MQRIDASHVLLAHAEARFVERFTGVPVSRATSPEHLDACLQTTRSQRPGEDCPDRMIVLAFLADMAEEARVITSAGQALMS